MALAEAGVEMFGLVIGSCAVRVHCLPSPRPTQLTIHHQTTLDQNLLVDPTSDETRHPQTSGLLSISCLPAMGTVTNIAFQGDLPPQLLQGVRAPRLSLVTVSQLIFLLMVQGLDLLRSKCEAIHAVAVKALTECEARKEAPANGH